MEIKLYIFLIVFLFFNIHFSTAQTYPRPEIDVMQWAEEIFAVQDEDLNYEDIYESLLQFYQNPLDLNKAKYEDLVQLFVLNESQMQAFLVHRNKFGEFLTIYELQTIPTFTIDVIKKLLPFVIIEETSIKKGSQNLWQRIQKDGTGYALFRTDRTLETKKGYTEQASESQKYTGSPWRTYGRVRYSKAQDFSIGFTLEKDAGEQFIWQPQTRQYGFDFYSFHAFVQGEKRLKSLAIGDFQLQIGQGLLLAGGFAIGKGAETVQTVRRPTTGLRPYTSALETGFFRGIGATYQLSEEISLTGFISRIRRNGQVNIEGDSLLEDNNADGTIQNVALTGFHRTTREINGKSRFLELTTGTHLLYKPKKNPFEIGFTFLHTQFDKPLQREFRSQKDAVRYQFEFSGQTNYNIGTHFSYQYQNLSFFGEGAISKSGGKGGIAGVLGSLTPALDFALVMRYYDRNFHAFFGEALREGSRNINEQGIYWGIKFTPNRQWKMAAYYDYFRFPWLRFRVDAPSSGSEWLCRITHNFTKKINVFAQIREERKDRNLSSEVSNTTFQSIGEGIRRNYWLAAEYKTEKNFTWNTRWQASTFEIGGKTSFGWALVQDLEYSFQKLRIFGRIALFETDDFDTRQYVLERDVLWFFALPPYYGQGQRRYVGIEYAIHKKCKIWLKWVEFQFPNLKEIGTAGENIEGNTRTDIRMQIKYNF